MGAWVLRFDLFHLIFGEIEDVAGGVGEFLEWRLRWLLWLWFLRHGVLVYHGGTTC